METAHRLPCGVLRLLPLSREDGRAWIERLKPACLPCVGRDSVNDDRQRDGSLKGPTHLHGEAGYLPYLQNRSSRNIDADQWVPQIRCLDLVVASSPQGWALVMSSARLCPVSPNLCSGIGGKDTDDPFAGGLGGKRMETHPVQSPRGSNNKRAQPGSSSTQRPCQEVGQAGQSRDEKRVRHRPQQHPVTPRAPEPRDPASPQTRTIEG